MAENQAFSDQVILRLLSVLEGNESISQRGLSIRVGVALGLTNSLLKRAVRKGFLKIRQAPKKRYVYYLTPKGFQEKSRLVTEYLSSSLSFFRQAREEFAATFDDVQKQGYRRIALYGSGELAEIATLSACEADVEVNSMICPGSNEKYSAGVPVYSSIEAALSDGVDSVVIAVTEDPQACYEELCNHLRPHQIHTAPLLHVHRRDHEEDAS